MKSGGSRGFCFLAELVGIVDKRPVTMHELFDVLPGIGFIPLSRVVGELVNGGVLRVCGWRKDRKAGKPTRVFGVGGEPSVPPPPRTDGRPSVAAALPKMPRRKVTSGRTMAGRFCALWHALGMPKSARTVSRECELSEHDCRFALHALRRARLVRVAERIREHKVGVSTAYWVRGRETIAELVIAAPAPRPPVVRRLREEIAA